MITREQAENTLRILTNIRDMLGQVNHRGNEQVRAGLEAFDLIETFIVAATKQTEELKKDEPKSNVPEAK